MNLIARLRVREGRAAARRGSWERARDAYRRASRAAPWDGALWLQLGHAAKECGDYRTSAEAYAQAARLKPTDPEIPLQIGHLHKVRGDLESAARSYVLALTMDNELEDAARELRAMGFHSEIRRIRDGETVVITPRVEALANDLAQQASEISAHAARLGDLADRTGSAETKLAACEARAEAAFQQVEALAVQTATLLDHISVAKALAFEFARHKAAVEADSERLRALVVRLDEAQIERHLDELQRSAAGQAEASSHILGEVAGMAQAVRSLRGEMEELSGRTRLIEELRDRVGRLKVEVSAIRSLEHRLDEAESAAAARTSQADSTLAYLLGRVEFVRRELLYEQKYGCDRASPRGGSLTTEVRIKNPEKLDAARRSGAILLNVGCGHIPAPDCINVDRRDLPGVDVVAEADDMPFDPGSVAEIRSSHLIEHFPEQALIRTLLPYWKALLQPGGRIRAIVPDGKAMLEMHAAGRYGFDSLREVIFGGQDYDGDFHYNLLTPERLTWILQDQGFADVEVLAEGRRNGDCYEFEITAVSPPDEAPLQGVTA